MFSPLLNRRLVALGLLLLAGCAQEDQISTYEVPKPPPEKFEPNVRLLVAIVEQPPAQWFFKLSGPRELIDKHEAGFRAFLDTVRFTGKDDSPVEWKLPEKWEQDSPRKGGEPFWAIFPAGKGNPPRMTVSRLGKISPTIENVNRWCRIDLGRSNVRASDLDKYTKPVKVGGIDATLVDMVGPGVKPGKHSPMPGMGMGGAGDVPRAGGKLPITYAKPEGWEETGPRRALDMLIVTSFRIKENGQEARVELTSQPGTVRRDDLANVNRWRGQVGMAPLGQAEFDRSPAAQIKVGGEPAKYFDLAGPKTRMLMVLLTHNGTTWYLKMIGDSDVVARNKTKFETLLQSVKFTGGPDE